MQTPLEHAIHHPLHHPALHPIYATAPAPPPLPPTPHSPRTLGDLEIKKSPNLVETGQCPASPHQKFIFGNYDQNLLKSRYQSFLVLSNFA